MTTKAILLVTLVVTLVVASGCQDYKSPTTPLANPGADEVGLTSVIPVTATPTTLIPTTVETPAGSETAIALAKEDLAGRLGVALEKITALEVEAVEWPDTSLGCPQPGRMYAQVITPGYRIILKVGGERYEYHSDNEGRQLVLCQDDRERIEVIRSMVSPEKAIASAREDLAKRLGIPVEEVTVVSVVGDEFPASNLGCPCPKCPERPIPAIVTGQRITMAAQGKNYEYHARGNMVVFCGAAD
ncbi:MAG: hypothetical protein WBW48_13395 [Anaerolineae bacterium]